MVGLKDLGETAWAIEQTLNLWLRGELEVGAEISELLDLAHAVFAAWIDCLDRRSGQAPRSRSFARTRRDALRRALRRAPRLPGVGGGRRGDRSRGAERADHRFPGRGEQAEPGSAAPPVEAESRLRIRAVADAL